MSFATFGKYKIHQRGQVPGLITPDLQKCAPWGHICYADNKIYMSAAGTYSRTKTY